MESFWKIEMLFDPYRILQFFFEIVSTQIPFKEEIFYLLSGLLLPELNGLLIINFKLFTMFLFVHNNTGTIQLVLV